MPSQSYYGSVSHHSPQDATNFTSALSAEICGAVTARIEREGDLIVWRDFGFENDYEEPRLSEFVDVAPIYFDARSYWQTLSSFSPYASHAA